MTSRRDQRAARRVAALLNGDVLAAVVLCGHRRARDGYWAFAWLGGTLNALIMRYGIRRISGLSYDAGVQLVVEYVISQRDPRAFFSITAWLSDNHVEAEEIIERCGVLRHLALLAADHDDEGEVRACAEALLDLQFAAVWKIGIGTGSWLNTYRAVTALAASPQWGLIVGLSTSAPVRSLVELVELADALVRPPTTMSVA